MMTTPFTVSSFGLSDVGLVREKNEDAFAICEEDSFFVLADGMGGHRAGDVAAKAAVHGLCAILKDSIVHTDEKPEAFAESLKRAFEEVNRITYRMGQQDPYLKGMGTTLLCLQLIGTSALLCHIGDSRIYRFRKGKLKQMTKDHSLLSELLEMGQIQPEEVDDFMYKNILTRAVGTEPTVEPTVSIEKLESQDTYLLCSDGLTDHLSDEELETTLKEQHDLQKAASTCIQWAKERGGNDNITLLLVRVE